VPLLVYALLAEGKDQLASRILKAAGVDVDLFISKMQTHLASLPKIQPGSSSNRHFMGRSIGDCLGKAITLKKEFGDQVGITMPRAYTAILFESFVVLFFGTFGLSPVYQYRAPASRGTGC
jgi:hypothetical protein